MAGNLATSILRGLDAEDEALWGARITPIGLETAQARTGEDVSPKLRRIVGAIGARAAEMYVR